MSPCGCFINTSSSLWRILTMKSNCLVSYMVLSLILIYLGSTVGTLLTISWIGISDRWKDGHEQLGEGEDKVQGKPAQTTQVGGSHVTTTKASQGGNFFACQDQAKPVPTWSQCGCNQAKLITAQNTPHHRKGCAHWEGWLFRWTRQSNNPSIKEVPPSQNAIYRPPA